MILKKQELQVEMEEQLWFMFEIQADMTASHFRDLNVLYSLKKFQYRHVFGMYVGR